MSSTDKNKLFEVTMSTFIKVDSVDDVMIDQGIFNIFVSQSEWAFE